MSRKKYAVYDESYKKLKLDEEKVLKTPVTTPFRIPIPGGSAGMTFLNNNT